jgi:hypothetical protein
LAGGKGNFARGAILTAFDAGITYGPHLAAAQEMIAFLEMYIAWDCLDFQYFDSGHFPKLKSSW